MSSTNDNPWTPPDEVPGHKPANEGSFPSGESGAGDRAEFAPPADEPTAQQSAVRPADAGSHIAWETGPALTPQRSAGGGMRWLAIAVVAALVGAGAGAAGALAVSDDKARVVTSATVTPSAASSAIVTPSTIRSVLEKVQPAVVTIQVNGGQGNGTGMIISPDGEVLTNAHVVSDVRDISVTLNGEKQSRSARLLGADTSIDAALIKIENADNLPTVELGESSAVRVGDEVVAIGNALALPGGPSVTSGIISAKDRSIVDSSASFESLIQTDAAINPGNSGGPLANMAGQVVGMNTVVIRGQAGEFENIGFAMPIDSIKPALADLRAGKSQGVAFLGVSTVTLDDSLKQRFQLTPSKGAVVSTVQPGSPADDAGLSRFDVITSLDGKDITTSEELVSAVRAKKPGDKVKLVYVRGDERREVTVTLAAKPTS